jgi:hypothetical protein
LIGFALIISRLKGGRQPLFFRISFKWMSPLSYLFPSYLKVGGRVLHLRVISKWSSLLFSFFLSRLNAASQALVFRFNFKYALLLLSILSVLGLAIFHNKDEIRSIWLNTSGERSDKDRTLNALRGAFGYGGLIHNFKVLILTGDPEYARKVTISLAGYRGIKDAIARYRNFELNGEETKALDDIETAFRAYAAGLGTVRSLIKKGRSATEIDNAVRIDDGPALTGIAQLEKINDAARKYRRTEITRIQAIGRLQSAMGYGGMIHNFMDFIFGKQPLALSAIEANIIQANSALEQYIQVDINSAPEISASNKIQKTLNAYKSQLAKAKSRAYAGMRPETLYDILKVDDRDAIESLFILEDHAAAKKHEAKLYVFLSIILIAAVILFNAVSHWRNESNAQGLKRS